VYRQGRCLAIPGMVGYVPVAVSYNLLLVEHGRRPCSPRGGVLRGMRDRRFEWIAERSRLRVIERISGRGALIELVSLRCLSSPLCAGHRMSMAIEDSVSEAWILECRGGYSVAFSEIEHAAMAEVLQSGDVPLDMFVTEGGQVTKEDAREMWAIVLDEWDKLIVQAIGVRTKPIRMVKMLTWCIASTSVTSGGGSLDALAAAAEASADKTVNALGMHQHLRRRVRRRRRARSRRR
jgi:hypothetical protein